MATLEQIAAALKAADAAGNVDDARRLAAAYREVQASQGPSTPPAGLKPGSREYAQWAMQEARAGRSLPQVSDAPAFQPPKANDAQGKLTAGLTSAVDAVPFVGPSMLDMLQQGRAAVQGMPLADVQAETRQAQADNPITSGVGTVTGAVGPFLPLGAVPGVGRVLGMSGSLPSRMTMGGLSGFGIAGGDRFVRTGDLGDATSSALLGGAVGAAAPAVFAGLGAGWNALTGRSTSKAGSTVGKLLADEGIDPASIGSRVSALGPDAMMMDLGPNLQALGGSLAAVPGRAQTVMREAVTQRGTNAARTGRVMDDVAATIGRGPDIDLLKQSTIEAQQAAAKPLYDAIRNVPLPVSGNFKFVLQTPLGKQAFREAARLAANDGQRVEGLTVGLVDYAKRALDDIASSAARAGKNNVARQARQMANILKSEADKMVPGYRTAREAFAGPAAVLDAIDDGAGVMAKDLTPPQLQRKLNDLTPSERDGYLQGFQAWMESQMGSAVNNPLALRNMLRKDWNEQKLRILLGDDIADDLLKRIDREIIFAKTNSVVEGNSETARRQATMGLVAPEKRDVSQVNLIGLVFAAVNKARQALAGAGQSKVNAEMAKILTGQGGPEAQRLISNSMREAGPSLIAPGGVSNLTAVPEKREPIEILIRGGNPALAPGR